MKTKQTVTVLTPRYTVEEVTNGYNIVDSTGKDEPYFIDRRNSDGVDISEGSKECAEHWAYTWNIVEMGYCGACEHKFTEGERRYPAVGFHSLDRTICFGCACSQED